LVASYGQFSLADTRLFFEALDKAILASVESRDGFTIQNFGSLEFGKFKARKVKGNPNFLDGKDKDYPETTKMFFKLSSNLKKLIKTKK
jgi:nucleoid DNA-binding protein